MRTAGHLASVSMLGGGSPPLWLITERVVEESTLHFTVDDKIVICDAGCANGVVGGGGALGPGTWQPKIL
jgi:hypothetical protein